MNRSEPESTRDSPEEEAVVDDGTIATAHGALDVVRTTSTTVDEQLDEMVARTGAQSRDAAALQEDIADLSATIEEIAATTSEISERSERAVERATEGRTAAQEAIEVMQHLRTVSAAVIDEVETLQEQVDQISTAIAGIQDIADQTNMLALNASIEAARAQQEGDGFSVVADEVKSLAEEVQSQADEIDLVLDDVQKATGETVDRLGETVDEIDQGAASVEATMTSIDDLTGVIETTADDVHSVATATDEQAATSETLTKRAEDMADRSDAIEEDADAIRQARSEQTSMLGEIDTALSRAAPSRSTRFADAETIPTGIEGLDERCAGGFPVGCRAVLLHDGETAIPDAVATICATALEAGYAVSLTPPPALGQRTLSEALRACGRSLDTDLRTDRLFVLDAFGEWRSRHNVFDLDDEPLAEANRTTDQRRGRPLLVVGNIAGEITVMGEAAARKARYENDDGVLGDEDTVLNVVDETRIDDQFAAFYVGAADLVFRVGSSGGDRYVELVAAPTVPAVDAARADRRAVSGERFGTSK